MTEACTQSRIEDLAIVVVNFNTSVQTLECLKSLAALPVRPSIIELVDNASSEEELGRLTKGLATLDLPLRIAMNSRNEGFAGACDRAIMGLLTNPHISRIMLLNSDAVALPPMATWLKDARGDLCGARMMSKSDPAQVDSLGIVMYRSGLASNRLIAEEPFFGPTGGCAVYSRRVLEALADRHGHVFDARFFCYAEDTDLAFRALLLGFEPEYCDDPVALHEGQASSGGTFNDFVLYHGIRNSIWVLIKDAPMRMLLVHFPWILAMFVAIPILHVRNGRVRVVYRIYRDAFRGSRAMWRDRRRIQTNDADTRAVLARIRPRFYGGSRLRDALIQLIFGSRHDQR